MNESIHFIYNSEKFDDLNPQDVLPCYLFILSVEEIILSYSTSSILCHPHL